MIPLWFFWESGVAGPPVIPPITEIQLDFLHVRTLALDFAHVRTKALDFEHVREATLDF